LPNFSFDWSDGQRLVDAIARPTSKQAGLVVQKLRDILLTSQFTDKTIG